MFYLNFLLLRSSSLCFLSNQWRPHQPLLCYAVCCGSPVCFQCYFNSFGKYHTMFLPPRCLPRPPLSLYLSLPVDICVLVSARLSFPLFSLIPIPHTLHVPVLWAAYMCTEALETTFFFFFKLASHLAALFSTNPRRGLTAGNINKMACGETENSCTTHTHATTL